MENITYDTSIGAYVFRIASRQNSELLKVILDEKGVEETDFTLVEANIKGSYTAKLAYSNRNLNKATMEMVTFNVPQEGTAYKAIFRIKSDVPTKVFISKEEGRWKAISDIPNTLLTTILQKRDLLRSYVSKNERENTVYFIK